MKLFQSNYASWGSAVVSIILYGASMALVHWDTSFTYRWVAFWLHISAVAVIVGAYTVSLMRKYSVKKIFTPAELVPFVTIVLVTEIANFLYLPSYRFVSFSDELRDGGLFALKIAQGSIKNIFGYGSYDAHGLIIPSFTRFFYPIFGSSVLTYRVPSALLASCGVILVYILVRKVLGKNTAFWSSLVLALMPLQMFFAHSQVVIGFTLFFVPVLMLVYRFLIVHRRYREYILMGSMLGLVAGFHASIRALACLLLAMIVIEDIYIVIKKWAVKKHELRATVGRILILVVFAFVGFGPRLLHTDPSVFFHTSRLPAEYKSEGRQVVTVSKFNDLKDKYVSSLMVYVYEPTVFFYPAQKPLFPPFIALFFVLGVGYSFFVLKNRFVSRILVILLVLPFFISAITDVINADHRVSTLLALASICTGIGITYALKSVHTHIFKYALGIVIAGVLVMQAGMYYVDQPANIGIDERSYVHMHAVMYLQQLTHAPSGFMLPGGEKGKAGTKTERQGGHNLCMHVSPANHDAFNGDWGYAEQIEYFLPGEKIIYISNSSLLDSEVYVVREKLCVEGLDPKRPFKHKIISCNNTNYYSCPINYKGSIDIHVLM